MMNSRAAETFPREKVQREWRCFEIYTSDSKARRRVGDERTNFSFRESHPRENAFLAEIPSFERCLELVLELSTRPKF